MDDVDLTELPPGLPVPVDDGAADHIAGRHLPSIALPSTSGKSVPFDSLNSTLAVLYFYPMTAQPGTPLPDNWDSIPGARGCTPQSCSFRDRHDAIRSLGGVVYGISSQQRLWQREAVERLSLPFELLSDVHCEVADALDMPTFSSAGVRLYKRLTLVAQRGRIVKVFYPVFPPDTHTSVVIDWITHNVRQNR